jgi:uncharacterized protein YkwD
MRGRLLLLAACSAAVLVAASTASADDAYTSLLAPSGTCGAAADQLGLDQAAAQQVMQCLTNYARAQSGLRPLQLNALLNDAGSAKLAADVSCKEFSHTPCGQPFSAVFAGYLKGTTSYSVGENIAWGTGSYGTPRQTMNGWLHSTGHRENILTAAYAELGIGYLPGQAFLGYTGATLWSQEFGTATRTGTQAATSKPTVKPKQKRSLRHRRAFIRKP